MAECPKCGFNNAAGNKYCGNCSKMLPQVGYATSDQKPVASGLKCPKCGYDNPAEYKYCANCSRTLYKRRLWSFHDQAIWNLTPVEKKRRLIWTGIFALISFTLLLVFLILMKAYS
jgi:uncharacterized membrane protein YvbJ